MSIDGSSSSDSSYYDCEKSCNTSILSESDEDYDMFGWVCRSRLLKKKQI
jgi:hypothetical protein